MLIPKWLTPRKSSHCSPDYKGVQQFARAVAMAIPLALVMPFSAANAQLDLTPSSDSPFVNPVPGGVSAPPATDAPPATEVKPKRRVGSSLALLETRFRNGEPLPPGSVVDIGTVVIEAIATGPVDALLADLTELGLQNGAVFGNLVSGRFPINAIATAELLNTLQIIRLSRPFTRVGAADNQADVAMQSDIAKTTFGIDGDGVSIGILSDSYDALGGEAADIASGDLPSGVNVLSDLTGGGLIDEGRAMAQLIHDIVPGSKLFFHTAFDGAADFAQGILELREEGADVIVDDIGYLDEPFFQDGVIAQAVDEVVADGAVYFSAAGNSANNSYEAKYQDSGVDTVDLTFLTGTPFELTNLHNFDDTGGVDVGQQFQLQPGEAILLSVQWDQPFASAGGAGSASDIDALLYDAGGTFLTGGTDGNVGGDAVEILFYQNTSAAEEDVFLVVGVFGGPVPGQLKWINFADFVPHTFATSSSTVFGHPNAEGAIAVGAAQYDQTPPFGVSPPLIEGFSSHGGTEILFDTAGNPISAVDRNKPEVVAPDGTDTTFFGSGDFDSSGFPDFFGTSAAAPHAAALAALQLECDPSLSPSAIQSQQIGSAIDMGPSGFDNNTGSGLVDALATLTPLCVPAGLGPDSFEDDDTFADASTIVEGVPQTGHNINEDGADIDFATFNLTCEADVVIETSGALGDTTLELFDSAMSSVAFNDDIDIGNLFSRITTTLLPGDYFIRVADFDEDDDISNYTLSYDRTCLTTGGATCNGLPVTVDLNLGQTPGPGDDVVMGTPGDDDIRGRAGNDTICGMGGNDFLHGNSGDDWIDGGDGIDNIRGGQGDDVLFSGSGATVGTGSRVFGGNGDDIITGGPDADDLRGGRDTDIISGLGGADEIFGNDGNDDLSGGSGGDTIRGGQGNDDLFGEGGSDDLNGGSGGGDFCDGGGQAGDTDTNCEAF